MGECKENGEGYDIESAGDGWTSTDLCKFKAHKLHRKYVESGSPFEINTSSKQRRRVQNTVGDLSSLLKSSVNEQDLLLLFENCKDAMLLLMTFALRRFKQKEEFAQVIAALTKRKLSV